MLAAFGLSVSLVAAASAPPWRIDGSPADAAELALQDAASREGQAGNEALSAVSRNHAGTTASGLAQLALGLRHLEARRHAEAAACFAHADLRRAPLRDRALLGLGQAQEALARTDAAAAAYLAAADEPASAVSCPALASAARLLAALRQAPATLATLQRIVSACPRERPQALLELGRLQLSRGDRAAAAAAFERLDSEHTASSQADEARRQLAALAAQIPARAPDERARIALRRGITFLAAGRRREAIAALRAVALSALPEPEADLARVSLARALVDSGHGREGERVLADVPAGSPYAAEAALIAARAQAARTRTPDAYEAVADAHKGTAAGEDALLALANHYQKDARDGAAFPWWTRLLAEYPSGRYVERAAWRVAWTHYRAGRFDAASLILESTARLRPPSAASAGFLYWAGRARQAQGQNDPARRLFEETVQRYKHSYHGFRAREALAKMGGAPAERPGLLSDGAPPEAPLPEPRGGRARLLLLADLLDEAKDELRLLPTSARVEATIAWIDWRRGRLRPAVQAMKQAHPEWVSAAGDRLPGEIWRILFPLRYEDKLRAAAAAEALDPALVAALILQESTFDPGALSRAGARGLMQVMPATGRRIARAKGQRFIRARLHDPDTSLDFGTHYLKQMSDRYQGAVERVLAAYNAGPHRVDAWTIEHGPQTAEEFIETIPFSETRTYVMVLLAGREHYRRLYGLGRTPPAPATEGTRP